jgi:6-phosphogluconolactonase
MTPRIRVFPDPAAVAHEATEFFVRLAEESIALTGRFTVALSGGSTPEAMYKLLTQEPFKSRVDWAKVEVFFGDERCVPPDHAESNYRMARESLLSKVPIPGDNVYRMRGEEPDHNLAAKEYGEMLKEKFADGGLDLCMLGMGDDGHTASLFPHTPATRETKHRAFAQFVEKSTTGPSWRITLTAPFINRCRDVVVLVTGAKKAARVSEVLEGPRDPERLPIQLIDPASGRYTWMMDTAAAGMAGDENEGASR